MEANKSTTVLFAEPSMNAKRYEASRKAVASAVINVAEATGGRVVKIIGGKMMVLFSTPDAAASAASKMHAVIDALPPVGGNKLGVHVGFHSEPQAKRGLSDDTVKLALRLLDQAQDGQTITSQQTVERLDPAFRGFSRSVRSTQQSAEQGRLCEITSWHQQGIRPAGWTAMGVLRLTLGDQLVVCSRERQSIVLGREEGCDVLLVSKAASREHCTVEYCGGDFVLRDHSSNGTYVTLSKNREICVLNDKLALPEHGTLAIGEPHGRAPESIDFSFALVN
jgi:hypothetical protein